jgi:hypothetical protein
MAIIRWLTERLTDEAINFEIRFIKHASPRKNAGVSFSPEERWEELRWLELLLRDWIERGTAQVNVSDTFAAVCEEMEQWSRQADVYCLYIAPEDQEQVALPQGAMYTHLRIDGPCPHISIHREQTKRDDIKPIAAWSQALNCLLENWI